MDIFVGNLAPQVTDEQLVALFKQYGEVKSAKIARIMFTDTSRGFAFVEMPGKQHSLAAIAGLNGKDLEGQSMQVNEARPRIEHKRSKRR